MARGRLAFKESDVARAIRGARKGGIEFPRVEILRDGRIVVQGAALPSEQRQPNVDAELDDELAAWRSEHGDG